MFGRSLATVLAVVAAIFLVLFLGGMASAWLEIRREKKAGVPVTRPGWQRPARKPPRVVHPVELVLLTVGLGGIAERLRQRRFARVSR